jgi:hypothetical protein
MNLDVEQIRARQKRIDEEIAKLQKESDELAIALRVLDRFTDKPTEPSAKPDLPPRPPGSPSTFDMVTMILAGAEKDGRGALTSRELMDEIRAKYWPGVQNKQILPSIFGFAKNNRLIREGDKWRRKPPLIIKPIPVPPKGGGLL